MRVTVAVDVTPTPDAETKDVLATADEVMLTMQDAVTRTLDALGWQVAGTVGPDGELLAGRVSVQLEVGRW